MPALLVLRSVNTVRGVGQPRGGLPLPGLVAHATHAAVAACSAASLLRHLPAGHSVPPRPSWSGRSAAQCASVDRPPPTATVAHTSPLTGKFPCARTHSVPDVRGLSRLRSAQRPPQWTYEGTPRRRQMCTQFHRHWRLANSQLPCAFHQRAFGFLSLALAVPCVVFLPVRLLRALTALPLLLAFFPAKSPCLNVCPTDRRDSRAHAAAVKRDKEEAVCHCVDFMG